jgi:hypothetical protein
VRLTRRRGLAAVDRFRIKWLAEHQPAQQPDVDEDGDYLDPAWLNYDELLYISGAAVIAGNPLSKRLHKAWLAEQERQEQSDLRAELERGRQAEAAQKRKQRLAEKARVRRQERQRLAGLQLTPLHVNTSQLDLHGIKLDEKQEYSKLLDEVEQIEDKATRERTIEFMKKDKGKITFVSTETANQLHKIQQAPLVRRAVVPKRGAATAAGSKKKGAKAPAKQGDETESEPEPTDEEEHKESRPAKKTAAASGRAPELDPAKFMEEYARVEKLVNAGRPTPLAGATKNTKDQFARAVKQHMGAVEPGLAGMGGMKLWWQHYQEPARYP